MGDIELIEKRVRVLEQSSITSLYRINKRFNRLDESLKINYPLIFIPDKSTLYSSSENIGYKINNIIDDNIQIISGNDYILSSIILPCYGVWLINYRLELNLSMGFTCFKSCKITVNTSKDETIFENIINDINVINNINVVTATISNNVIYRVFDDKFSLKLSVNFVFGRNSNQGFFNIIAGSIPIFSATRIS